MSEDEENDGVSKSEDSGCASDEEESLPRIFGLPPFLVMVLGVPTLFLSGLYLEYIGMRAGYSKAIKGNLNENSGIGVDDPGTSYKEHIPNILYLIDHYEKFEGILQHFPDEESRHEAIFLIFYFSLDMPELVAHSEKLSALLSETPPDERCEVLSDTLSALRGGKEPIGKWTYGLLKFRAFNRREQSDSPEIGGK